MFAHANNSTTVECISQQLCIGDLHMQSRVPYMNMGKRLLAELELRGMKPARLCDLVPDMDIGALSALYKRDSKNSKYAPAIAKALGLEPHWLMTGEGNKYLVRGSVVDQNIQTASWRFFCTNDSTIVDFINLHL